MTTLLMPGQVAPWFHAQALEGNPRYAFHTAAGRWIVMLMMGSGGNVSTMAALRLVQANRAIFDDIGASFFGVTIDPQDVEQRRIAQDLPGIRWFLDYDRAVSTSYGAVLEAESGGVKYTPHWLLIDPMLRVRRRATLAEGAAMLADLPGLIANAPPPNAPILTVPDILPPALCRHLIDLYDRHGGEPSGFMREENGMTVLRVDPDHKQRSDYTIEDNRLINELKTRLATTLHPMIQRSFQFDVTRIERFLVACYDSEQQGHFRAHRDNTTKGTAHRRFAVTINLNAGDYDGGDLCFPEFGSRTYCAPTGGAIVFSCSLLHEARPVTRGRRYAFLPFLYDEAAARIRQQNLRFLSPELGTAASAPAGPG